MATTVRLNHANRIDGLLKALRENISLKDLEATYLDNIELKKQVDELETANSVSTRRLAKTEAELETTKLDAEGKSAKLEDNDKEKTTLTSERDAAKVELESAKKKMARADNELGRLKGFAVMLKPTSSDV
jgi:hypothetical protein